VRSTNTQWRSRAREHHRYFPSTGRTTRGREDEPKFARVRIEVPGLFGEPSKARQIEQALASWDGLRVVRANARTGTVLCIFDPVITAEKRAELSRALEPFMDPNGQPAPSWDHFVDSAKDTARRALQGWGKAREIIAQSIPRQTEAEEANGERNHEQETPPWHALPVEAVLQAFEVDQKKGLTSKDAERIVQQVGPNVLAGVELRSSLEILAGQIFTVPTAVLAGAAGLSVLLGDMLEAGAILLVVGSNVAVGYFTESRAEELLDAWGAFRVEWARVLRQGTEATIAARDVVPGDILCLRAGESVVADARIVWANDLTVDESTLTGESEPAEKKTGAVPENAALADRDDMLYAGTVVASGEARAVVVATGPNTELGAIQRALSHTEVRAAPLEQQLDKLGQTVAWLALSSSAAVVSIGLMRRRPLGALVRSAVALGVAAIPEGFPAVGTTALALVSQKLFKKGIVIRRLAAAETLGAVSVACADKTGTLTENRMRVAELYVPALGRVHVEYPGAASNGSSGSLHLLGETGQSIARSDLREIGRIAALNADVEIADGNVITAGSGTERALVEFSMAIGYPARRRRRLARRIGEERRSADRPFMTTIHEHPDLGRIELVKGAPESVIDLVRATAEEKRQLVEMNEQMASRGLRVLALAWRRNGQVGTDAPLELAGLVGMRDPPRPGVREALATLSQAGVRAVMLTGDQERTARAIGAELGIAENEVRSRVTPEAKLEFVRELQAKGAIVAMTGDGVNDGPALKAADVGIAMGERGTDIARAVADVVLAHDDLQSLAAAVREGRRLYDNVRRAIDYLVATNTSEVLVMVAGGIAGIEPLGPLQLLWINVLTDVAPALALALEPAETGIMRRPPRDPAAPLFSRADYGRIALDASQMAFVSLTAYGLGRMLPKGTASGARTMSFASLVTAQLLHAQRCRAATDIPNRELAWALGLGLGLEVLALRTPLLRRVLRTEKIPLNRELLALGLGTLPTILRLAKHFPWAEPPVVWDRTAARNNDLTVTEHSCSQPILENSENAKEEVLPGEYQEVAR
jgi:P-type Ca2+ transporter type 2C